MANGNTFLLDGNDNTEQFYVENAGRTRILSQISQDAVQEFQVVSANFSAEYGRAIGGVVNTVTTQRIEPASRHRLLVLPQPGYGSPRSLRQLNRRIRACRRGGSVGGPIIKDKLFFFLNGDFTRRNYPLVDTYVKSGMVDSVNQVWVRLRPPPGHSAPSAPPSTPCCRASSAVPAQSQSGHGLWPRSTITFPTATPLSASFNFMHFNAPDGLQNTYCTPPAGRRNSNGNDYGRVTNGRLSWTSVPTSTS